MGKSLVMSAISRHWPIYGQLDGVNLPKGEENMRGVTRNRLTTVVIATIVFALVGVLMCRALNMPMDLAFIGAPLLGL